MKKSFYVSSNNNLNETLHNFFYLADASKTPQETETNEFNRPCLVDDKLHRRFLNLTDKQQQSIVIAHAMHTGLNYGFLSLYSTAIGSILLHHYSPAARRLLSPPVWAGVLAISALFPFWYTSKVAIAEAAKSPETFFTELLILDQQVRSQPRAQASRSKDTDSTTLEFHETIANWVFDYPLKAAAVALLPAVVATLAQHQAHGAGSTFQKIAKPGILGQSYVMCVFTCTMVFHHWMSTYGRYVPHEARVCADLEPDWTDLFLLIQ